MKARAETTELENMSLVSIECWGFKFSRKQSKTFVNFGRKHKNEIPIVSAKYSLFGREKMFF